MVLLHIRLSFISSSAKIRKLIAKLLGLRVLSISINAAHCWRKDSKSLSTILK